MVHDRRVAGIRCAEVLEDLSDYVDGQLPPDRTEAIQAHLRACDWCERFGGRFASAVALLRAELREPEALPAGVRERLRWRLRQEIG
jgi:anti-sigma factor RsiW